MTAHAGCRWALAIFCCLALARPIYSAELDPLEAALAKPARLDVAAVPLADFAASLARGQAIPVVLDRRALADAGIRAAEIAITARSKDKPLGDALDDALTPHKLAWIARHEVLLITTAAAAQEKYLETRVYKLTRPVAVQRRINAIIAIVTPESWAGAGGPGDAAPLPPRLMAVRQSPVVHRQIAAKFSGSLTRVFVRETSETGARDAKEKASETSVEKALATKTDIDLRDAPLAAAAGKLVAAAELRISIDAPALNDEGLRADDLRVTLQLGRSIRLASGLSLLLEQADPKLAWTADESGATITTAAVAKKALLRRSYKVGDVLPEGGIDTLIRAIQDTIAPADWEDVGGAGTLKPGDGDTLDVAQSDGVHRQLRQFFAEMRAGRDGR